MPVMTSLHRRSGSLERGFRRLTPQQRALLVLRHFEGREPTEIAEILGIRSGRPAPPPPCPRAMRAALDAENA